MPLTKPRFRISEYRYQRTSRLRKQEQKIQKVTLSLTSMVDMFAILVIFLLTNNQQVTEWLVAEDNLQLPSTKYYTSPKKSKKIVIQKQDLFFEDTKTNLEDLKVVFQKSPKQAFIILADRQTSYEKIQPILESARSAGLKNIELGVSPKNQF